MLPIVKRIENKKDIRPKMEQPKRNRMAIVLANLTLVLWHGIQNQNKNESNRKVFALKAVPISDQSAFPFRRSGITKSNGNSFRGKRIDKSFRMPNVAMPYCAFKALRSIYHSHQIHERARPRKKCENLATVNRLEWRARNRTFVVGWCFRPSHFTFQF